MDTKPLSRKWFAVGIILMFVGVTIASTINFNTVKASTDDDLVEVTTQACGIQGYGDTTVKLTREQYQDLRQYLVEFRARLNQTSTRDETIPIFKEAVRKLDTYGLLPKGMSVAQAELLVTESCSSRLSAICSERWRNIMQNRSTNIFCLVTGEVNWSLCVFPFFIVAAYLGIGLSFLSILPKFFLALYLSQKEKIYFPNLMILIFLLCDLLYTPFFFLTDIIRFSVGLSDISPVALRNIVGIGIYDVSREQYSGSPGWVTSVGLSGRTTINGTLYGVLAPPFIPFNWSLCFIDDFYVPAMIGFIGLSITSGDYYQNKFFLGGAVAVAVSSEPPEGSFRSGPL